MTLSTRMIVVLTAVGLISGALLAGVGILTKDRIAQNREREIQEAITKVVPGTENTRIVHQEDALTVYEGLDASGLSIGYAVLAKGTGFQDIITLMVGTDSGLTRIRSLTILEQKETPGLGAKITSRDDFLQFWDDKDISSPLTLRKPAVPGPDLAAGEINTITGATISSQKVMEIVNQSLEQVRLVVSQAPAPAKE